MGSMDWLKAVMRSPWPAAVLVTTVTLGAIGTVLVVTTPAGCRLARNAGVHLNGANCQKPPQAQVFPTPTYSPTPFQVPPSNPANPSPVYPSPTPPDLHAPGAPPYLYETASASYPPTYAVASGFDNSIPLSCRLPLYAGGPGSGGFLVFPDRTFIGDPRSGVTVPSPSPSSTPPPQGRYGPQGWYGLAYDRALARWVPVPRSWITPDGKRYAYPGAGEGIYVVDVATNTQTEIGDGRSWQVLDVEADGVYADETNASGTAPGLWLVPFSGAPSQLTDAGYWSSVGYGAAYGTETSAVPQGVGTLIDRFDLKTHAKQHWFQVDTAQTYPYGFDASGHPIFMVQKTGAYPPPGEIWLVTGLGTAEVLTLNNNFNQSPVADSHGLWFMSYQMTWLLVPGQGMYQVANIGGTLAGGCA